MTFNTFKQRQNGCHFAGDIFKCILFDRNCSNLIKVTLLCVSKGLINNKPALVQVMPNRQAIIWTSDGLFYWHIYASLGLSELTHWGRVTTLRNQLQWNFNRNSYIFIQLYIFIQRSSAKWKPFCLGLNVLNLSIVAFLYISLIFPVHITGVIHANLLPFYNPRSAWSMDQE